MKIPRPQLIFCGSGGKDPVSDRIVRTFQGNCQGSCQKNMNTIFIKGRNIEKGARDMEAIRVQGVWKTYGNGPEKESILRDVSFALEEGSFTALTGISGSGKTTLLHLLAGLQDPEAGEIFLLGRKYAGNDKKRAHPVPSKARQSGASGSRASSESDGRGESGASGGHDTGRLVEEEKLERILKDLALAEARNRYPAQLSGGERQRAVFGRALFSEAEILLAGRALRQAGPQAVPGNGGDAETVCRALGAHGADGNP